MNPREQRGLDVLAAKDRFQSLVALYLEAKMEQEGLTYEDVTRELGLSGKNYAFRARHSNDDPRYRLGVPDSLLRLLAYLDMEPREFAPFHPNAGAMRPGDLEQAIMGYEAIPEDARNVLRKVVRAFVREWQPESLV